jgi:hypothetical protein
MASSSRTIVVSGMIGSNGSSGGCGVTPQPENISAIMLRISITNIILFLFILISS